jgi:WS/DGAT/MGAT family acyltransferase
MSTRVSLSGLDAAFLSLETPCTPMNVVGTLLLDAASDYSYERVLRLVEARLSSMAPFRQRLAAVPWGLDHPVWIDDPDFRFRSHVHRVRAPAPGSERILAERVARIAAQPLDRSRPLWELWVVEGLAEGRVALVFKLHHAVADGSSGALLLLRLLDSSPDAPDAGALHERLQPRPAPTGRMLLAHALSRLPERSARFVTLLRDTARSALAGAGRPTRRSDADPSRMPMPFSAPRLPWNTDTSPRRTVAYGRARLADVKVVNAAFGTTVNHVVLAACTQTLRKYLEAHGGVPDVPLVAAIPVSLRSAGDPESYGNRVSAFLVHLPVHVADPLEQLLAVRDSAVSSRRLHTRLGVGALGEWAEFVSSRVLGGAARFYSDRKLANRHRPLHNLVISNVRGPGSVLYAAGARLSAAYLLGPLMDGAGMNITVSSYADSVDFGIIACERSVPCVGDIALGFGAAVADLYKSALEETSELSSVRGVEATSRASASVPVR